MRRVTNFCDYFVICTGTSDRQIKAIAEGIDEGLNKLGIKLAPRTSFDNVYWILLDIGDVIVHVFEKQAREFYGLEYLWQDAPQLNWKRLKA